MNKEKIKNLEEFLNERWQIAVATDEEMGNKDSNKFLANNVDYVYYQGALDAIAFLGLDWKRNNGKHRVFK